MVNERIFYQVINSAGDVGAEVDTLEEAEAAQPVLVQTQPASIWTIYRITATSAVYDVIEKA